MAEGKEKSISIYHGKMNTGKHHVASNSISNTSSRVVRVAPHERGILIGPNASTLRMLLSTYEVRMSLSRGGRVVIRGQEVKVGRAIAHINTLLRAAPAAHQVPAAYHNFTPNHVRQRRSATKGRMHHAPEMSPYTHFRAAPVQDTWRNPEVLRSLGRRVEAALRRIFDYVSRSPVKAAAQAFFSHDTRF